MKNNVSNTPEQRHALIAGWFSFENMGTTAGDLIARDLVGTWLKEASITYDTAVAASFPCKGGVNWQEVNPQQYTDVVFVCGPFGNGWPLTEFLNHFSSTRLIGINLSLLQSLNTWNPFDLLYERDSSVTTNPDITFNGSFTSVPLVGIIRAHKQKEYGERALHDTANAAIDRLLKNHEAAVVHIDTALQANKSGLRTPAEIETLISRMDMVITTRLHGTVLALKNGVPAIPIDPIAGGAKISSQVNTLQWPVLFNATSLNDEALSTAFAYCLTAAAREQAIACTLRAKSRIEQIHKHFLEQMAVLPLGATLPPTPNHFNFTQ
jgi:hypothetical protein